MIFKRGDIAFVMHHDSGLSRVISWFMGSRWSHCLGILGPSGFIDETYVCETSDFEVVISTLERYLKDPNVTMAVYTPKVNDEYRWEAAKAWERYLGEVYGYFQLLSLGLRRLLMRLGIKTKNLCHLGIVCDELVLEGLRLYPIDGLQGVDAKSMDTEELYQIVSRSAQFDLVLYKVRGSILG